MYLFPLFGYSSFYFLQHRLCMCLLYRCCSPSLHIHSRHTCTTPCCFPVWRLSADCFCCMYLLLSLHLLRSLSADFRRRCRSLSLRFRFCPSLSPAIPLDYTLPYCFFPVRRLPLSRFRICHTHMSDWPLHPAVSRTD